MSLAPHGLRLAACGLVAGVACTPDFQSPSQVTDLRVLAIRQEALEQDGSSRFADAFVDLDAQTAQRVRVRALVADPHPRQSLVSHARVCSPTDSGRCEDVPTFELGAPMGTIPEPAIEQQPEYTFDVPPAVVALALQDDRLKGFGGIRVQLSLDASDGDAHDPVLASKILLYSTAPDSMRNHNPELVGLEITREGVHVQSVPPGTIAVTAGVEYGLRPLLGPGSAGIEDYDVVDLSGQTIHLRETPRYSFFATAAISFDRDDADEPLPGQPEPVNGIARFTAGAGSGSMWVVARDGRGGIGWISAQCTATAPP